MKNNYIGETLRKFRIEKKLTLNDIASKLNISVQALSQYELGKREIDYDTVIKITDILGIPSNEFFTITTKKMIDNFNKDKDTNEIDQVIINLNKKLSTTSYYFVEDNEEQGLYYIRNNQDLKLNIKVHYSDLVELNNKVNEFIEFLVHKLDKK